MSESVTATSEATKTFLDQNKDVFAELLTFIDFAEGLTIGFIEVNQEKNKAKLLTALNSALTDTDVRLQVLNFAREEQLRFLLDDLTQRLADASAGIGKTGKRVLWLQGLEAAVGTDGIGAYPPVLQDLNYVRDAYQAEVPYPLLFVLPDYAITRVSKYAPDFWAWRSGVFRFRSTAESVEAFKTETLEQPVRRIASAETQAQIDRLQKLLMELKPTGKAIQPDKVFTCAEIYYKLGSLYLTQKQPDVAEKYLQAGLKLAKKGKNDIIQIDFSRKIGNAYKEMRRFEEAKIAYETAMELAEAKERLPQMSILLADLGDVALAERQFEKAREYYQQSLSIDKEKDNRYGQASTCHQLGIVAQKLREYEQARSHYLQALTIKEEFNDRYSQASTHGQMGLLAEAEGNPTEAASYLLKELEVSSEFNNQFSIGMTINDLKRLYSQEKNSSLLTQTAKVLGRSVTEVEQLFADDDASENTAHDPA
ncbi:MAG: tetratricopeptide repeat protein [Cyanobacteria bacterium J06649_4]